MASCHANPQYFADHRPLPAYGAKAATYDRHTRRSMDTSYSQFLQKRILEGANIWLGGHEEYLFSKDNTVEIATQYNNSIQTYSFDRKTRYLQIGERRYYVAKLTDKHLEIIWGNGESVYKLQLDRLLDGKLHIIQKQSVRFRVTTCRPVTGALKKSIAAKPKMRIGC